MITETKLLEVLKLVLTNIVFALTKDTLFVSSNNRFIVAPVEVIFKTLCAKMVFAFTTVFTVTVLPEDRYII